MPRHNLPKKKNKAMEAMTSGKLSLRRAAEGFSVNKSTLHDTVRKKVPTSRKTR